ncbi:hypothetical protein ACFVRB_11285 [Streptomyces nojiriensis]|uniref:hypothetical protein n=1 Tax=Streptomyces nojiriensis TaxID=66374 RepID=UPI0036DA2BA7
MDDSPDRARRTVEDLLRQAHAPSTNNARFADDDPYNRPGRPDSEHQLNEAMQNPQGWRPSGSWPTSVHNDPTPGKQTNPWNRRMVMDDESEYGHYERTQTGDNAHYYRSGRAKNAVAVEPPQFVEGAKDGYGH